MEVHHEYADQAAAYALGALTPAERAEFEAHLAKCALCAAEVRSFAPVVGDLADDVRRRFLRRLFGIGC